MAEFDPNVIGLCAVYDRVGKAGQFSRKQYQKPACKFIEGARMPDLFCAEGFFYRSHRGKAGQSGLFGKGNYIIGRMLHGNGAEK